VSPSLIRELLNALAQALHEEKTMLQCTQTKLATECVNASAHYDASRRLLYRTCTIMLEEIKP
jgi:hypothetical protein